MDNRIQIGDIWLFDYYKTIDPVHVLVENIDNSMPNDPIIHYRKLEIGETNYCYMQTFLSEQPTKVA